MCGQFTQDVWLQPIGDPHHAQQWMNQTEQGFPLAHGNARVGSTMLSPSVETPNQPTAFPLSHPFEMNESSHQPNDWKDEEGTHPPSVGFKSIELINGDFLVVEGKDVQQCRKTRESTNAE